MKIYTIGFTKRSAEDFFTTLKNSGALRLVDVRLNNSSQLAGFSKRDDLRYFLKTICGMEYLHVPELAPTQEMLDSYKSKTITWDEYERIFLQLIRERKVEDIVERELIDQTCLLCSETAASKCHRRLVAEYLQQQWGDIQIVHL